MIFLPGLAAFLVCFVYLGQTSSKPLEPNAEDPSSQLIHQNDATYEPMLMTALPAASSGKNLYKLPESPSEDTVRSARAIMTLFVRPSQWSLFEVLLVDRVLRTAEKRWNSTFPAQVRLLCEDVGEHLKNKTFDSVTFDELKKKVDLPKPAKNYVLEMPSNPGLLTFFDPQAIVDDAEIVKFYLAISFQPASGDVSNVSFPINAAAVRAVKQLSRSDTLKWTVDSVFVQALDDFVKDSVSHPAKVLPSVDTFMTKVDEYFAKNSVLKDEYQKIKQELTKSQ